MRYTIYDSVEGRVRNAVVTLITGAVTNPDKQAEITEMIEKIRGVQDLKNGLTLPVSPSDDRIRAAIANQIYRDPLFSNYSRVNLAHSRD